jgi:hypothetical protein
MLHAFQDLRRTPSAIGRASIPDTPAKRLRSRAVVSALLVTASQLTLIGCAGSLAGLGRVEHTVGHATHHDIVTEVPEALRRHGYAIYQNRETSSSLYIETGWRERAPFEDEAAAGVDYARTRFILRARSAGAAFYTVRLTSENEVRGLADGSGEPVGLPTNRWTTMEATGMYEDYVRAISEEIQLEVDAGVRTYGRRPPGS